MGGENVCDDFTVITKGERQEVLLHWPPCPLADFSAALMVSASHPSPSSIGSRSADVMGVSWGTAILLAGEAGRQEEGGCGSDMFHHFKITCALLECWTCLLCGVVHGMDECPSPLEEGFILWDMVIYVNPLDHTRWMVSCSYAWARGVAEVVLFSPSLFHSRQHQEMERAVPKRADCVWKVIEALLKSVSCLVTLRFVIM